MSKRIAFATRIHPEPLPDDQDTVEIEVGPGESHYHFSAANSLATERHYIFHLRHPDSRALVTGRIEASGSEPLLVTTAIHHHAPRTAAETLVRTLSRDNAAPAYHGLIRIETGGDGSESYLNHHSLLLGEKAASRTIPSLEILADQVKCSHAATVRGITEQELFYLRSRGLSRPDAERLLVEAFLADVTL